MKLFMLLSDGFEEIEAAAPADLLRRAGVSVEICSITGRNTVNGARGIRFLSDSVLPETIDSEGAAKISEIYDGVILPGGQPNAGTLRDDERVIRIVKAFYQKGKITAAICAAPCIFEKAGILKGKKATSYPDCIDPASCAEYTQDRVVRDGTVITSRSAGTAIDFGLEILRGLGLSEEAESVRAQILL
ncbi:MAG: DJ-1 family glyoxalase III [Clostridia bacterium]